MKLGLLTVALAACVGCGKASTTSPTPPGTHEGAPSAHVGLPRAWPEIVPRTSFIAARASRDIGIDAISATGVDLNFYRQLVRNGLEAPGNLEAVRRWTTPPLIYLKTVDETGVPIDPAMLETTARTIIDSAALWTGGRFGVAGLQQGIDTRRGQAGWITVRWPGKAGADRVCGLADVAQSGGVIDLFVPTSTACGCSGSSRIRPRVIRHELGHAFGFFHTDNASDVMTARSGTCDGQPSARERAAAAVAYARPVGNIDPDVDPSGAVSLTPLVAR